MQLFPCHRAGRVTARKNCHNVTVLPVAQCVQLLRGFSHWAEAFNAHHFSERATELISNFMLEMERKYVKDNDRALHTSDGTRCR